MGHAITLLCHQLVDEPCLYRDELLDQLIGLSPHTVGTLVGRDPSYRLGRFYSAARSRFVDETVAEAINSGARQVVVLDTGLATTAYRKFPSDVRIFETDRGSELAWKRRRLADIGVDIPESLRFVETDTVSLAVALADVGFDRCRPAVFSWIGVVPALPLANITDTFEYIGACTDAQLIFDYMEPPEAGAEAAALVGLGLDDVTAFQPLDVARLLRAAGFGEIQDRRGLSLVSLYLGGPVTGSIPVNMHVVRATTRS